MLAPFGRAWEKVMDAYAAKIRGLGDEDLLALAEACRAGRWTHELEGPSYWCSGEVERIARTEANSRGLIFP